MLKLLRQHHLHHNFGIKAEALNRQILQVTKQKNKKHYPACWITVANSFSCARESLWAV